MRRRGMTLMERVVAIAITGMMAAAGAATFASIIDHRRVIKESTVETERAAALRELVRTWIAAGTLQIQQGGGPRGLGSSARISARPGGDMQYGRGRVGGVWVKWLYAAAFAAFAIGCGDDEAASEGDVSGVIRNGSRPLHVVSRSSNVGISRGATAWIWLKL